MRAKALKADHLARALMLSALVMGYFSAAGALEVVLNDVAADRVERQRHYVRGELPLSGTPDLNKLDERLASLGLTRGRPIYVRIFKEESELELWMQNRAGTFTRLAVYPICHWTGSIGPKLKEGDKQSPEGFYSVGVKQTKLVGRWRRAFNVGFPNLHDQLLSRTGSYILIHGGCSSVGCFAMTDPVQEEIYALANAALAGGQERFQVHIFPFRMTAANLARHAEHEWAHTWADLRPGYDSFERTHVPPRVALCGVRYKIADGLAGETGNSDQRLPVLRPVASTERPADPTAVLDSDGNWIAPNCEIEDEARRRPAEAVAAEGDRAAPPEAPVAGAREPAITAADEPNGAAAVELTTSAIEPPASPLARSLTRPHSASKPERTERPIRKAASSDTAKGAGAPTGPLGQGFGSATFRGRDRMTAHGG